VVAAASAERQMKPVSQAAKLAAAETELACVKMVLADVKLDRDELRQERDDWRWEAEALWAEKLIAAKKRPTSGALLPRSAGPGGDASSGNRPPSLSSKPLKRAPPFNRRRQLEAESRRGAGSRGFLSPSLAAMLTPQLIGSRECRKEDS
jgi:hypothetical protein